MSDGDKAYPCAELLLHPVHVNPVRLALVVPQLDEEQTQSLAPFSARARKSKRDIAVCRAAEPLESVENESVAWGNVPWVDRTCNGLG